MPVSTGVITPAPLTITATSDFKVYDGTTSSSQTPTVGTLYDGDTVTGLTQAFASNDVLGTYDCYARGHGLHRQRRR